MRTNGLTLAAALSCFCTAAAAAPAHDHAASTTETFTTDVSSNTRHIFSTYIGSTVVILPEVFLGEAGYKDETERFTLPFMHEFPELFKGSTVLDIGTGNGIVALYAATLGAAKVIATDISTQAIANTRLNAQRLKQDAVIETRLVAADAPLAYTVIRPEEKFDIILTNAVQQLDPAHGLGPEAANPRLGLSILDGLKRHLKPDGSVILLYRSKFMHDLMTAYALHLGYAVERHEAVTIRSRDWCSLYLVQSAEIARREKLPPEALKYNHDCVKAFTEPFARAQTAFPELWGKKLKRSFPGLILIRNKPPQPTD